MRKNILLTALCTLLGSSSANAALIDNGGGLIYDNVLDITWTERDDVWQHDWYGATTYASDLVRGGSGDWRLPYASVAAMSGPMTASPVDCSTATELACRHRTRRQPRRPVEIAPYRGLFPSPPLFDRMPTYRTQGKRSLNFLSAFQPPIVEDPRRPARIMSERTHPRSSRARR